MIWILLIASNVVSFGLIYLDKQLAKQGRRRISEKNLLLAAALGGWPASFLAQQLFRHKTKKGSFKVAFWITAAISVLLFVALISQMR